MKTLDRSRLVCEGHFCEETTFQESNVLSQTRGMRPFLPNDTNTPSTEKHRNCLPHEGMRVPNIWGMTDRWRELIWVFKLMWYLWERGGARGAPNRDVVWELHKNLAHEILGHMRHHHQVIWKKWEPPRRAAETRAPHKLSHQNKMSKSYILVLKHILMKL